MILIVLFCKIHTGENMLYAKILRNMNFDDLPKKSLDYANLDNADDRFITRYNVEHAFLFQYSEYKKYLYDIIINDEEYKKIKNEGFNLTYINDMFLLNQNCENIEDLEIFNLYDKYRTTNHFRISKNLKFDLSKSYGDYILLDRYNYFICKKI